MSPMLDVQKRHAEVFRIRLGERDAKGYPVKLTDAMRVTSPNRNVVQAFVDVFGGEVRPWDNNGKPEFEAKLPTTELPIMVLPGQSISQWWEKYKKSVCERRCDGVTDTISKGPCVCPTDITERVADKSACNPMTRVNVVCPDVAVVGAGSLVTHGMVAAETLPQSIAVAEAALSRGLMVPAVLRVVEHKGKTHYIVPQIEIVGISLTQLTTGETPTPAITVKAPAVPAATAAKAIAPAPAAAAPRAARTQTRPPLPNERGAMKPSLPPAMAKVENVGEQPSKPNSYAQALHILASDVAKATELDGDLLADLAVSVATGGKSTSANDLTRFTKDRAVVMLCEIRDGKSSVVSAFDGDGKESYSLAAS